MPANHSRAGGRPPKPLEDHLAEGTYRAHRHGPVDRARAQADGMRPEPPDGMPQSALGPWHALLDDLERVALLDSADAPLYEAFATAVARAREARDAIEEHGLVVEGTRGTLVANPAVRVEMQALTLIRTMADQLAIGPRARASLGIALARGVARAPKEGEEAQVAGTPGAIGPSPRLKAVAGGKQ